MFQKIRNTPLHEKGLSQPLIKKRLRCFTNKKHSYKKKDSTTDVKRGFGVSQTGLQPPVTNVTKKRCTTIIETKLGSFRVRNIA
jgi:hypothetical protein